MDSHHSTITIHPFAPPKPVEGAPCNGCGVCCLAEPCPLGRLLTGRKVGSCALLHWDAGQAIYRCGVLLAPHSVVQNTIPAGWWARLPLLAALGARALAFCLRYLGKRWIAAGVGCDSSIVVEPELQTSQREWGDHSQIQDPHDR